MHQYCKTLCTAQIPVTVRYPTSSCVLRHIFRTPLYRSSQSRIPHACLRTTSIVPSKIFLISTFSVRSSLSTFITHRVHSHPKIPTFDSTRPLANFCISLLVLPSRRSIPPLRYCEICSFPFLPCNNYACSNNGTANPLLQTLLTVY